MCLAIMESLYRDLKTPEYRASDMLREKVDSGRLGKKSGEGFYKY